MKLCLWNTSYKLLLGFLGLTGLASSQNLIRIGPGISTWGGAIPGVGGVQGSPRIRIYSQINSIYDSSMLSRNPDGSGADTDRSAGEGMEVGVGAFGYRRWQRSGLGLDYHSVFPRYWPKREYDGGNHLLSLGFTRELTPHVTWSIGQSGGSFTRRFLYYTPYKLLDSAPLVDPTNQFFDNRTSYSSTISTLTYQKSQRLFLEFGGGSSLVRHRSDALVGLNAYQGSGSIFYAASPAKIIGFDYNFSRYAYTQISGKANLHNVGINYSQRIGRYWELAWRGGVYRAQRQAARRTLTDPSLQPIVGSNVDVLPFAGVNYYPSLETRLSRRFRHSSLAMAYSRNIDPGNGLFLVSQRQFIDAGFTYTGLRRWNFGLNGGYGFYKTLTDSLGKYQSYRAGCGLTYQIQHSVHLVARFDSDQYQVSVTNFSRARYRMMVGLALASGERPLPLW